MGSSFSIRKFRILLLVGISSVSLLSFANRSVSVGGLRSFGERCVGFFTAPTPKKTTKANVYQGRLKIIDTGALSYQIEDGTTMTVIDKAWADRYPSSKIANAIENYYLQQGEIYQRRLDKFKEPKMDNEGETNPEEEYQDRTIIILNTTRPLTEGGGDILGGIRVVFSQGLHEKLPFQYDSRFANFLRKNRQHWAAEVGRLTADSKSNPGLSLELIQAAGHIIFQMPQVQNIYVHTSRLHTRLYGRMGLVPEEPVHVCDALNCLMTFTRDELLTMIVLGGTPLKAIINPH